MPASQQPDPGWTEAEPTARLAARLDAMERLCGQAVGRFDATGRLVYINPPAAELLGCDSAVIEQRHVDWTAFRGAEGQRLPKEYHPVWRGLSEGLPVGPTRMVFQPPGGERRLLGLRLEPVGGADSAGQELLVLLTVPYGTGPERQRDQLLAHNVQSRHLLDLVFSNVDSGLAVVDSDDRLALWNPAFEHIWQLDDSHHAQPPTMDELIDHVPWSMSSRQRAQWEALVAGARENMAPTNFVVETSTLRLSVYTCRLAGGRRLWAIRDLSEHHRLTRELAHAKVEAQVGRDLLESVLQTVPVGILAVDRRGRARLHNREFASLWSLDPKWLASHPSGSAVAGQVARVCGLARTRRIHRWLRQAMATGSDGQMELELPDGRFFSLFTAPLRDGGRMFTILDRTERQRLLSDLEISNDQLSVALRRQEESGRLLQEANAMLAESDRLKSEFLASTSHELRSPLNTIIGYLGLITDGIYSTEEDVRSYASKALVSANQLLEVITNILDVARLEAGRVMVQPEPISIVVAIEEVAEALRPEAEAKGLALLLPLGADELLVLADPGRLRQALTNVLDNAIKFTAKGQISIAAREVPGREVLVEVKDTGIGIPQDRQGSVFETFVQGDGGMRRHYGGTGLGLSITRSLVQLMAGRIEVQSEGPGRGTTVSIRLPSSS